MREIHQLRDVESLAAYGITLSTPSSQAAKLFDAAISQFVGWYSDTQLGGMESTMERMLNADPEFIGGRTLVYCVETISGRNANNSPELRDQIERIATDAQLKVNATKWEKLQVNALQHLSNEDPDTAIRQWEEILVEFPSDILSLHLAGITCLISGRLERIGDISGRILPSFKDECSLSSVHAWHSFGLSETNLFTQAERHAYTAMSMEPRCGWSAHSLAHVFEMTSRCEEGVAFMNQSELSWNFSDRIAGHNYWHWSLYHLTKGEFDAAKNLLEEQLFKHSTRDSLSLLYLMSMEDISIDEVLDKHYERIGEIVDLYKTDDHHRPFIDAHVMMGLCVTKKYDEAEEYMNESIRSDHLQGKIVNENLLRSILAYSRESYSECVQLLWPIKHNIKQIGGSNAQRDLFNLMLINASLRSHKLNDKLLARQLIEEREIHRSKSLRIERLKNLL
ncbi:Tetratricopeptide repeat protein 38 [Pseudolycoriella hygida]|uniref:Tetratricopeptide repeat protein 38 n=1 Tax=Pseudolycoriella hygida TaxID=35572 RepID=A0A9Q0S232_9DIPT|nr:Tetratricopeptide repeat protein 38 [Pseudolycoriella hygida]